MKTNAHKKMVEMTLVLLVFCAVFSPPILPFNSIYILAALAGCGLIVRKGMRIKIYDYVLFNLCVFFSIYVLLVILINYIVNPEGALLINRVIVIYQIYFLIPFQFIVSIYITDICKRTRISEETFWRVVLISGLIEVGCVIIAFLFPSVRAIFLDSILAHGGLERVYADPLTLQHRGYGWADSLLDTFGYGMGIYGGCCLINRKMGLKRYIFVALFIFSTMLNSRTGLAIFMIAAAVWLFDTIWRGRYWQLLRIILFVILVVFALIMFINSGIINNATLSWIYSGFRSVWNLLAGKTEAYSVGSMQNSLLSKRFWIIPDTILGIVFGRGHSVFGTREIIGINSDVGYINYIWICGFVGMMILLIIVFHWFNSARKATDDYIEKEIIVFLMVSFYVMFIKGNIITHTAGTFLTILIITYYNSQNTERALSPCVFKEQRVFNYGNNIS